MQFDTVAIPFAQGIRPSSRTRLLEPGQLATAQNCHFPRDQGPEKRLGHVEREVVTQVDPAPLNGLVPPTAPTPRANFSTEVTGISDSWIYGYGLLDNSYAGEAMETSTYPAVGNLYGQFTRDGEVVAWDGFRLLSYAPDHPQLYSAPVNAVMPALRAAPGPKTPRAQTLPEMADNGAVRTTAWVEQDQVFYSVQSVATGAMLVAPQLVGDYDYVRIVTTGPWTHILCTDPNASLLEQFSFHQDEPLTLTNRTIGTADLGEIDVKKCSETRYIIGRLELVGIVPEPPAVQAASLIIHVMQQDGSEELNWTADTSTASAVRTFAISPNRDERVGIAWEHDNTAGDMEVYFGSYDLGGEPYTDVTKIVDLNYPQSATRITIADRYLYVTGADTAWTVAFDDGVGAASGDCLRSYTVLDNKGASATSTLDATVFYTLLASHAFRVGNRTFVWAAFHDSIQLSYLLLDEELKPVGKLDFGTAYHVENTRLPGVNFTGPSNLPLKDRMVFHGALGYRQRTETDASADTTLPEASWAEPSIRTYYLDFLPRLSTAQAGRSAQIAGAQLWSFDGAAAHEATFHLTVPGSITDMAAGGGSLTLLGKYRYRVALAHKNIHGEEIRSFSMIGNEIELTGGNNRLTLTFPPIPTRRTDSYFLIYRTEDEGLNYYLVSSRDPADFGLANGFVYNSVGTQTVTFIDELSDADLLRREAALENAAVAGPYLDPLPAPACEIVAAGRDRVWLAGGELAPGEIAPSRLFIPNEQPTYSPALNLYVDRGAEAVTAIGFVGDVAVIFRERATYILDSDGVDNTLGGNAWTRPRLALAELGARAGTTPVLGAQGLYFHAQAGLRLIGAGGALAPWGDDMDSLAEDGDYQLLVVPHLTQVRFYSRLTSNPTLVYDYKIGQWCTWTVSAVGASLLPTGKAILARSAGTHWVETDGRYTDGDRPYEMVVKTAPLHAGSAGDFQRVRRWLLLGAGQAMTLRARLFYNDASYHSEEMSIVLPEGNEDIWGDESVRWGTGLWGDSSNPDVLGFPNEALTLYFRDGLFRIRKRPARQKCSVFAIEFSDLGVNSAGFSPHLLALELGRKVGLDRAPGA